MAPTTGADQGQMRYGKRKTMHLGHQTETRRNVKVDAGALGVVICRYWRLLLLGLVVAVLYAPVLAKLISQWYQDPDYSHGFVVPVLSGYLVWRKRESISRLSPQPSWFGVVVVLGSLGLLFLGSLGAELFLTRVSLLGTIVGLALYFRGWVILRTLAFPLAFLGLMVPLPAIIYNQIVFPLQLVASRFATVLLEGINVMPVLREGNLLILPNYTLEVVEACSGIRSLMTLVALSLGYGYLAEESLRIRSVLVLAIVPVAIVSNGLRVTGTALLAHYWGLRVAEGFLHSFSGLAIFLVATAMLLLLHGAIITLCRRSTAEAVA